MSKVKIKINNGHIQTTVKIEVLKKTKCFRCGKEIYIIPTMTMGRLPVTKCGGEWTSHALDCPYSSLMKEQKKIAENIRNKQKLLSKKKKYGNWEKKNSFRR